MTQVLTLEQLQSTGLIADAGTVYAERSHLLPLTIADASQAACDVPLFISRNSQDGGLMLSALCSFLPGHSLLVQNGQWRAVYRPVAMQIYPCFCMQESTQNHFVFLADPSVLSNDAPALYTAAATPSEQALQLMQKAQDLVTQERQTFVCLQQLDQHNLLQAIELQLQPEHGDTQRIRGLMTINEDRLFSLEASTLKQLQQNGLLQLAQTMLNSLLQLNRLVQLHNQRAEQGRAGYQLLRQLRIELDRDAGF